MVRLFAAIEVPPDVARDLRPRMDGVPDARWRPDEALHVTLRFFGEVAENVADDLCTELARIQGRPFELTLDGVGAFGDPHQSQAIWAGVSDSEPLRTLAARCDAAGVRAGLKKETRRYKPHVTLAYLKHADQAKVAGWLANHGRLQSPPFRVTWFGLYSSVLHPTGSRYTLEREFALQ